MRGHWTDRARQQIRRVGFDHQAVGRNVLDDLAQMAAAALVAQPAGNADVEIGIEAIEQFFARAGETMHHGRADAAFEFLHHVHEIGVGIALVQEQRLTEFGR